MLRIADVSRLSGMSRLLSALAALAITVAGVGLTATAASATAPGGDGKLALVRSNQIYTIRANGSGLVKLTSTGKNYRPKWSPNGNRLAYVHETAAGRKDLWVMQANGSGKRQVTTLGTVSTPGSWSPDGANIAFGATIGTDFEATLHKVKSTAPFGSPVQLLGYFTNCTGCEEPDVRPIPVDRFLAWSTDGATIALFNHYDAQLDDALYMYDVATGEARQVDATGAECCGEYEWLDLFWGPTNGFGFTWVDREYFGQDPNYVKIFYSSTNSSSRPITGGFVAHDRDTGGAPSPSGRYMAFTNPSGGAKVYIANVDGSGRRVLTAGYQPDWQPRP